jgi:hypothetical protein
MKKLMLSLCVFSIVGCSVESEKKAPQKDRYVETSSGTPIPLRFQKGNCQDVLSEQVFPVTFPSTVGEDLVYRPNATNILNRFYSEILLGGQIERTYEYFVIDEDLYLRSSEKVVEKPLPLILCSNIEYELDSFESAAIHVSHVLDIAHKKLVQNKSISGLDYLSPISLKIAPIIETTTKYENSEKIITKKSTLVNNAYYNALTKEIVYLPQGWIEDEYIPFNGVPLWHIPITASHEYGHHVFSHLMPNYFSELDEHNHTLCFDNREKASSKMLADSDNENIDSVLRAINEGFADLIGNYAIPKKYSSLDIVPCLNDSREIDVSVFANGDEKVLNYTALRKFFMGSSESTKSCLEVVDYADSHILGALIAHTFDSIFTTLEMDSDQRLQKLINWIAALNDNYPGMEYESAENFFERAMELFIDQLHELKSNQTQKEKVCNLIEQKAPLLSGHIDCYYNL